MDFETRKKRASLKYQDALEAELVDTETIEINNRLNNFKDYYTISSCAGRCAIISKSHTRSKYQTVFHEKTHQPSKIPEFSLKNLEFSGELWLLVEAVNFHIKCRSLDAANNLQKSALRAKLSYSKFQSVDPPAVVEILGTGNLASPLGNDGDIFIRLDKFNEILLIAKDLLEVERNRMVTWYEMLAIEEWERID